jgi:hypothetical protein
LKRRRVLQNKEIRAKSGEILPLNGEGYFKIRTILPLKWGEVLQTEEIGAKKEEILPLK